MDIIKFYEDNGIEYRTEGHKHCRPGWVNTECPFCTGNPGYHLGYPLEGSSVFVCWRCGNHSVSDTVSALLNVSKKEAFRIIKKYEGITYVPEPKPVLKKRFKLPKLTELTKHHKLYLKKRGFLADSLAKQWGIKSTTPLSYLDKIDYRFRIFIPIYWEGQMVSFQTRAVSKKEQIRYKACPKDREIINHKHILYKSPNLLTTNRIIVVEGVTDVWKLGKYSVATFGIKYKRPQVRELAKYKQVVILFDNDPQAQEQAEQLQADLLEKSVDCWIERVDGQQDPGDLSLKEAQYIARQILKRTY